MCARVYEINKSQREVSNYVRPVVVGRVENGMTALDIAESNRNFRCVKLLEMAAALDVDVARVEKERQERK